MRWKRVIGYAREKVWKHMRIYELQGNEKPLISKASTNNSPPPLRILVIAKITVVL